MGLMQGMEWSLYIDGWANSLWPVGGNDEARGVTRREV